MAESAILLNVDQCMHESLRIRALWQKNCQKFFRLLKLSKNPVTLSTVSTSKHGNVPAQRHLCHIMRFFLNFQYPNLLCMRHDPFIITVILYAASAYQPPYSIGSFKKATDTGGGHTTGVLLMGDSCVFWLSRFVRSVSVS